MCVCVKLHNGLQGVGAGHLVLNLLQMVLCTLGVGCVNLYDRLERSAAVNNGLESWVLGIWC